MEVYHHTEERKSNSLLVAASIPLFTLLVMGITKAVEMLGHQYFGSFGVIPRELKGAIGIITAPLIHGDLEHLFNNAISLLLFGTALFYFYRRIAIKVWLMIYFISGAMVWIFARGGYSHIGISGVIYGLAFFLFFGGLFRKNRRLAAISLMLTLFYGSMIWGVLPGDPRISWEAHLMGAIIGTILAIYFRNTQAGIEYLDPPPKPYMGPDLIGDEWKLPEPDVIEYGISYPPNPMPGPEQHGETGLRQPTNNTNGPAIRINYVFRPTDGNDGENTTQPQ